MAWRWLLLTAVSAEQPLCHGSFRSLEECLGHDHERLQKQCGKHYDSLRSCLSSEWIYLDSAGAYEKPPNAFNRLKPCRHGLMLYNPLDWYIGRSLEVYGEWAEKKLQLWALFIQPGHVVVEVGAHVGTLTLALAKLVGPSGRVIALEPFYPSFAALAANTALNSLQNVEVLRAVAAQKAGRMRMDRGILAFQQHDFFNYGSMDFHGLNIRDVSETMPSDAETSRWDDYAVMKLDTLPLGSRWDFLKLDAEAMELDVLKGASTLLSKFKPLLFIEYRNPQQKKSRLLQFLRKLRYECVLLRLPIFNEQNFRKHREDIWSNSKSSIMNFNLFCRSTERAYPHLGDVAVLFSTAVDTDVQGLRSTPLVDPLEVMARHGSRDIGQLLKRARERLAGTAALRSTPQRKKSKTVTSEEVKAMNLNELLDLVDPPMDGAAEAPRGDASLPSTDAVEITFEELLALAASANDTRQDRRAAAAFPAETTIDEL